MSQWQRQPDAGAKLAIAAWVTLILLASVVASRRLAGAFTAEIPVLLALLPAAAAGALSLAAGLLFRTSTAATVKTKASPKALFDAVRWTVIAVTLTPPLLTGLALLPTGSAAGYSALATLLMFLSIALLAIGDSYRFGLPAADSMGHASTLSGKQSQPLSDGSTPTPNMDDASPLAAEDETGFEHETANDNPDVSQWMTRRWLDDGADVIEGAATAVFQSGQRQAILHVAFCPPFTRTPEVVCEVLTDVSARVKVASVQTYGARLHVRLESIAEEDIAVRIGFVATCPTRRDNAA